MFNQLARANDGRQKKVNDVFKYTVNTEIKYNGTFYLILF